MLASSFIIETSLRVPGLGILVQPAAPIPDWLSTWPLHTVLALHFHRPGQLTLLLHATIEEVSHAPGPPARALLLDADPGELPNGSWLNLDKLIESELF